MSQNENFENTSQQTEPITPEDLPQLPPEAISLESEQAPLFESWSQSVIVPPTRIPHLGHLCIFITLGLVGTLCGVLMMLLGAYLHLFGVTSLDKMGTEIHFLLGGEAIIYLVTLALSFWIFPLFWNMGFLDGIHWRGATALKHYKLLVATAVGCFGLAMLDEWLLPGPSNAPIEEMFRSPGAAWLLFAFGISFAPLFEEVAFRGFLLPSLATACDWVVERITHKPVQPLDENGHPQWSMPAMVIASLATSLPFALVHREQQGNSIGPFVLLIVISMVLCAARLKTRSLAASTLLHSCYNFLLFTFMLIGTGGFKHLN
jgi:membrane protease YdiL (CAAX protease family)